MPQLTYASKVTGRNRIYPKLYTEYKGRTLEPTSLRLETETDEAHHAPEATLTTQHSRWYSIPYISPFSCSQRHHGCRYSINHRLPLVHSPMDETRLRSRGLVHGSQCRLSLPLTRPSPPQRILLFPLNLRPMARIITLSSTLVRLLGLYNTAPPSGPNSNQRGKKSKGAY